MNKEYGSSKYVGNGMEESKEIPGKISQIIGTGRHAQTAIAWRMAQYSFLAGFLITAALVLYGCFVQKDPKSIDIDAIQRVWGIFCPVITLALGYIFGIKGSRN